jgi:tRNA (guanine-N7-)-methyltransferase
MPKIKHKRFQEIARFDHVIEWTDFPHGQGFNKAVWFESLFSGSDKLTLELACGKAEYTVGLAKRYPDRNFIGVDIKGNRMWVGANYSLTHQLRNTAFLRAYIGHLEHYIPRQSVEEIWIIFPDPQLKKDRKKLTSARFLELYKKLLVPGGTIHLKTDSPELFEFTLEQIELHNLTKLKQMDDVYGNPSSPEELVDIQTYYEGLHVKKGRTIRYVQFSLDKYDKAD